MKISESILFDCPYVTVQGIKNFDISKIFDCGQCFRFEPVEHSKHEKEFSGIAMGKFVSFAQDGDTLTIYGSNTEDYENIWKRYLDIERDYDAVDKDILSSCDNAALAEAVKYGNGIRILAQDPFECIISFIISQNNNIPRIKKIIESLCKECGEPIELSQEMKKHVSVSSSLCTFPSAAAIYSLGVDGLFELKTGFRAKYIYDAVSKSIDGSISIDEILLEPDVELAIDKLCQVKGIGRKVASCALLFGFGKYDAFPVDVWMKRVAVKYFGEEGNELTANAFGSYAGIAQQYLFYYERYNASKEE